MVKSKDLFLVSLEKGDSEFYKFMYETRSHPDVNKYLLGDSPKDYTSHKKYLDSNYKDFWILTDYDSIYGYSSIKKESLIWGEVGFVIHPKFQGKGLGRILVENTVHYALNTYYHLMLQVKADNKKAIKLYESIGFTSIGNFKEDGIKKMYRLTYRSLSRKKNY